MSLVKSFFAMIAVTRWPALVSALSFAPLFQDFPVLQRAPTAAAVWGTGAVAGATILFTLDGVPAGSAAADGSGAWQAELNPQAAAYNRTLVASDGVSENSTIVSFGEVILCSGQSNMQMPIANYSIGGFSAFNGSAEIAAAGAYSGKIRLASCETPYPVPTGWNGTGCYDVGCITTPCDARWNAVTPGVAGTVRGYSAVCWYTGKSLFDSTGGSVPVGLIAGSVGGSPIEFWLPEGYVNTSDSCGVDEPPCDNGVQAGAGRSFRLLEPCEANSAVSSLSLVGGNLTDSNFYNWFIAPFVPYSLSLVVWDQGERDVLCLSGANNHTARYACLQRTLISSWRSAFKSDFVFVGVQLPGYIGDCDDPAVANSSYANCVPGVYNMRLAQDAGVPPGDVNAAVVPTYDLSCPFGVNSPQCPWGSVHNIYKTTIGARLANAARKLRSGSSAGYPRAVFASAVLGPDGGNYTVTVNLAAVTPSPIDLAPTQFCSSCCGSCDFDASADGGATWVNGTAVALAGPLAVSFSVELPSPPTHLRYTANQGFPQCAVVSSAGLPLYPFLLPVVLKDTAISSK